MADYVRVRDKETGHHLSISRAQFEREGDVWQELKQPAVDAAGDPLPPKHHTSVATEAAGKKASQSAAGSEKES